MFSQGYAILPRLVVMADRFPGWVRYSGVGLELAGATAGLALVGYWIDTKYGTSPWGMLGGVAIGIVGAQRRVRDRAVVVLDRDGIRGVASARSETGDSMTAQAPASAPQAEQESPLEHIVQHPLIERPANLGPLTPDGRITLFSDQIAMVALAGLLLIALVPMMIKRRRGRARVDAMLPTRSANMLEAVCDYLRKEVAEPVLHQYTDRFIKYIWSVFFFVLTVNILGLLPIPVISNLFGTHLGGTATGNIWMTATLAIITMFMMVANGLRIGGEA